MYKKLISIFVAVMMVLSIIPAAALASNAARSSSPATEKSSPATEKSSPATEKSSPATEKSSPATEKDVAWDFETDPEAQGFTFLDQDGDNHNWYWHMNTGMGNYSAHSGDGVAASESYSNDSSLALTPDNWMLTPAFTGGSISFWMIAQDASYSNDFIGVYVSTDGGETWSDELFGQMTPDEYQQFTVDLSDYEGETLNVAFRHYNSSDMFIAVIDDIEVSGGTPVDPTPTPVDPTPTTATVVLSVPADFWFDGSGYQMLIDADATAYGTIIPEEGALTAGGDAPAGVYDEFEYKIPVNADGSMSTQNIIVTGQIAIEIPAGTYDWCITNPTPGDRIWIASSNGNIPGRYDDFEFEGGNTYTFTVTFGGQNDQVDLEVTEGGAPVDPTPTPGDPTPTPVDPTPTTATVVLSVPADFWLDGSGYQMLIDADATAYGTIIPEEGALTAGGDAPAGTYDQFEYKIPVNADGSMSTQNVIVTGQIAIEIPAGTYDWCITNPTPGECIWIASSGGNIPGRYDDFEFEGGNTYTFTVTLNLYSGNDRVDLEITEGGAPVDPTEPPVDPTEPPVQHDLDEALNVEGGELHFESEGEHPWIVVNDEDNGRLYAMSGNAGVHSSESILTTTITANAGDVVSFEFQAWGEGSGTFWDYCEFAIDGERAGYWGAYQNDWELFTSEPMTAGEHTLTWKFHKDNSISKPGDCFMVDNVEITEGELPPSGIIGDVDMDGDVDTADALLALRYVLELESLNEDQLAQAEVDGNGEVTIVDALLILRVALGILDGFPTEG